MPTAALTADNHGPPRADYAHPRETRAPLEPEDIRELLRSHLEGADALLAHLTGPAATLSGHSTDKTLRASFTWPLGHTLPPHNELVSSVNAAGLELSDRQVEGDFSFFFFEGRTGRLVLGTFSSSVSRWSTARLVFSRKESPRRAC